MAAADEIMAAVAAPGEESPTMTAAAILLMPLLLACRCATHKLQILAADGITGDKNGNKPCIGNKPKYEYFFILNVIMPCIFFFI